MNDKKKQDTASSAVSSWGEWFNRTAQYYQDPLMKMAYYRDGQSGQPVQEQVMRAMYDDIWRKLDPRPEHAVLDVGCGVGLWEKNYTPKVQKIIGTDISLNMIQDACRLNPKCSFLVCRAESLPFKAESFDRILCYGVFLYFSNKKMAEDVLDGFLRVMKKDGLLLIGDILEPWEKQTQANKKEKITPWWPGRLNHRLSKLYLPRSFFLEYCEKNNLRCAILEQTIQGRMLPSPRYDVAIRLQ
ncbi:MAG: class I SAM-dependent methyltransferase [Candidatus Omnitrophota bacterium]